jgi:hypothetical protein
MPVVLDPTVYAAPGGPKIGRSADVSGQRYPAKRVSPSAPARKCDAEFVDDFPCNGRKDSAGEPKEDIVQRIAEFSLDVGEYPIAAEKPDGKPSRDADEYDGRTRDFRMLVASPART